MLYILTWFIGVLCGVALGVYIINERIKDIKEQRSYHTGE